MKTFSSPVQNNMVPEDTPLQHIQEVMPEQDETEAIETYTNDVRITCSLNEVD